MHLPNFNTARALVVGDLMLDRYWHGQTSRISPEAPVPVVCISGNEDRAGGAGNVALNMASLGVQASVMGYCGRDEAKDTLISLLENKNVQCDFIELDHLPTISKLRVLSRHQQLIRLDFEGHFRSVDPAALLKRFESRVQDVDVIVLSDYDKGTLSAVNAMISICKAAGKPVLIDPKGLTFEEYSGADLITPNQHEFEAIVGRCHTEAELVEKGYALLEKLRLGALLITRSEHGMTLLRHEQEPLHLPTQAREVFDVTGAGDTVIAVLAACLAAGEPLAHATALANLAAGMVVGKMGTATVTTGELKHALDTEPAQSGGVIEMEALLKAVALSRGQGETIVLTNGCFDILHRGHVEYLKQARALGDRLIVLVNSDASVRRLKGPERPINTLEDRMALLASLECVDWVMAFDEDTPRASICRILPDILVKGGDYQDITEIAGHDCVLDNGGQVMVLGFSEGYSTTRLIEAIRK